MVPAPVRPSSIQGALGVSSTAVAVSGFWYWPADGFAFPLSTGASVRCAGAGRVLAGSSFSGFGPEDLAGVVAAGIVRVQPTSIRSGSARWAPPGWVVAWDASKISG